MGHSHRAVLIGMLEFDVTANLVRLAPALSLESPDDFGASRLCNYTQLSSGSCSSVPCALRHRHNPIHAGHGEVFHLPARPVDLDIVDLRRLPQPKVRPRIVR